MDRALLGLSGLGTRVWQRLGPGNRRVRSHRLGLLAIATLFLTVGVWISPLNRPALAHDPHDVVIRVLTSPQYSQDQTVTALIRSILYKSTDGGDSWTRIVNGLDNQANFTDLAQTPEASYLISPLDGVYVSTDGDATWAKSNTGLAQSHITQIAAAGSAALVADDEDRVYYRASLDQPWKPVLGTDSAVSAMTIQTLPDGTHGPAAAGTDTGQLYTTTDQATWVTAAQLPSSITGLSVQDSTIWISTAIDGVWRSTDGGKSIEDVSETLADKQVESVTQQHGQVLATTWYEGTFRWEPETETWQPLNQGQLQNEQADKFEESHFRNIALSDQFDQDGTAFVSGFGGLFKTTDGGQSWRELETLSNGIVIGLDVSPNYANDQTLAIVNYVGEAYRSTDGGQTWQALSQGLEIPRFNRSLEPVNLDQEPRRFYHMAFSPDYAKEQTIFASMLWQHLPRYVGQRWQVITSPTMVRSPALAPSPNIANDGTVFAVTQRGPVLRSRNRGRSYETISDIGAQPGNESPSVAISPAFAQDQTLFATGTGGVYKSTDGGQTWQSPNNQPLASRATLRLAISPNYAQDQTVLVGSSGGLFGSQDGGVTWQAIPLETAGAASTSGTPNDETPEEKTVIEAVAFSPDYANDGVYLVSLRGRGLLKTADRGQTFLPGGDPTLPLAIPNNFETSSMPLVFSPNYAEDQTIFGFGAADAAVFKSIDGGATWSTLPIERAPIFESYRQQQYSLPQTVSLALVVYRNRLIQLGAVLLAGVLGYGLASYLRLEKLMSLNRRLVRFGTAGAAMLAAVAAVKLLW